MRRFKAALALACAAGLAIAGCAQSPGPPASATGPSSGSVVASQAKGAPASSGAAASGTDAPSTSGANSKTAAGGQSPATMAKYGKIKNGMTYAEVTKILGKPSIKIGESASGDIRVAIYSWNGADQFSTLVVTFTNDKVSSVGQSGLK